MIFKFEDGKQTDHAEFYVNKLSRPVKIKEGVSTKYQLCFVGNGTNLYNLKLNCYSFKECADLGLLNEKCAQTLDANYKQIMKKYDDFKHILIVVSSFKGKQDLTMTFGYEDNNQKELFLKDTSNTKETAKFVEQILKLKSKNKEDMTM